MVVWSSMSTVPWSRAAAASQTRGVEVVFSASTERLLAQRGELDRYLDPVREPVVADAGLLAGRVHGGVGWTRSTVLAGWWP